MWSDSEAMGVLWMIEKLLWGAPSFWIERLPLYIGKHWGFFRDHQLSVELKYSWGGPELVSKVKQGRVLIGELGLPPFLKGFSQGLPARVIGSSLVQQLDHYVVGRPGIDRLRDLGGRRIGILSPGSCDSYFIRHMLQSCSIDPDSEVELVPLGKSYGRIEEFSSGRIDAGFLVEPFVSLGEKTGQIQILATVKDFFPRYQWGIIFGHNDLLEQHPDLVRRAMAAFCQSCLAIREKQEEAAAFGAQVFRLEKDIVMRAILRGLETWELDGQLDIDGVQNCVRVQQDQGAIPRELDWSPMIHEL